MTGSGVARLVLLLFLPMLVSACDDTTGTSSEQRQKPIKTSIPTYTYEVVNIFPHDPGAFTQGLIFHDGALYESTGQYGSSTLRKVDLTTGRVTKNHDLPERYFAEGMTILGDRIYQLTWQENTVFVYDMDFKLTKTFNYPGEGWGLTTDGKELVMSDGSDTIRFVNPDGFEITRTVRVRDERGRPVINLNELEWINGEIWANIWQSEKFGRPNHIARIDPKDGKVLGWIDLRGISIDDVARDEENSLNGIAYDAKDDRIFVTGKQWTKLFEIKLKPKQ